MEKDGENWRAVIDEQMRDISHRNLVNMFSKL